MVFKGNQYCHHSKLGPEHTAKSHIYYCQKCELSKDDGDGPARFVEAHKNCEVKRIQKEKILALFELNEAIRGVMAEGDADNNDVDLDEDLQLTDSDDDDFHFVIGGDERTSSPINDEQTSSPINDDKVEIVATAIPINKNDGENEADIIKKLRAENLRLQNHVENLKKDVVKAERSEAIHHKSARDTRDTLTKVRKQKQKVENDLAESQKFCAQHREDLKKINEHLNKIKDLKSEKKDLEDHNSKLLKDKIQIEEEYSSSKLKFESQIISKNKEIVDLRHELQRLSDRLHKSQKCHEVEIHIPIQNNRRCGPPLFFHDLNGSTECYESENVKCLHITTRGQGPIDFTIRNPPKNRALGKLIIIHVLIHKFKISSFFQSHKQKGHAMNKTTW